MLLSVVIPVHNEEDAIAPTVDHLVGTLRRAGLPFEIVLVNDHSSDGTAAILDQIANQHPEARVTENEREGGYGNAVRWGLNHYQGDAVAIFMADNSDSPDDLVRFVGKLEEGYDCVFGDRWCRDGVVIDYPWPKRVLNRMFNTMVAVPFGLRYRDLTNAFKLYRSDVIEGIRPLLSPHFNLTLEMPLKAIIRGYSYTVVPNRWTNRTTGVSKLRIREMGSRYLFIFLYCLIEKQFSRGDYLKRQMQAPDEATRASRASSPPH